MQGTQLSSHGLPRAALHGNILLALPLCVPIPLPVCTLPMTPQSLPPPHYPLLNVIQARRVGERVGQWHTRRHCQHLSSGGWLAGVLCSRACVGFVRRLRAATKPGRYHVFIDILLYHFCFACSRVCLTSGLRRALYGHPVGWTRTTPRPPPPGAVTQPPAQAQQPLYTSNTAAKHTRQGSGYGGAAVQGTAHSRCYLATVCTTLPSMNGITDRQVCSSTQQSVIVLRIVKTLTV